MSAPATTMAARLRLDIPDGRTAAFACLLTLVYVLAVGSFDFLDVYHRHFFEPQYSIAYNAMRAVFTGYLFWMVYFTGFLVIGLIGRRSAAKLPLTLPERLAAGFFVGAAAWTALMLVFGYARLYDRPAAVVLTVPLVAASAPHLLTTCREIAGGVRRAGRASTICERAAAAATVALCLTVALLLFVVKGLYPGGGHDYYTHYFPFYTSVVDNHHIWPNSVWYHYFYSKGMGLFFLGMLLSDPLAPSLVTFCFVAAAACCLFSLVRQAGPAALWAWVAVILYFALYIPTYGTGLYRAHGGWGQFQKLHEVNAAFLVAIVWMSVRANGAEGGERRFWRWCCGLCAFAVAFVLAVSSALVGLFVLLMGIFLAARGRRDDARMFFWLGAVAAGGLAAVLVLNYVTTGLPLDSASDLFWPILDLRRLNDWGVIVDVTWNAYVRSRALSEVPSWLPEGLLLFAKNVVRADLVLGFAACTAAGMLVWAVACAAAGRSALRSRTPDAQFVSTAVPLAVFIVAAATFAATVGMTQPVSAVRYCSFLLPLLIAFAAVIWQGMVASAGTGRFARAAVWQLAPAMVLAASLVQAYGYYGLAHADAVDRRSRVNGAVAEALRFVGGRYSIYDGYKNQSGWPGAMPWGAVHPGLLAAWKEVGPGKRIWSLHVWSYCMLPDCRVEGFTSFRISAHAPEVYWGAPDRARDILKSEGLDYFFLSWDMAPRDPLPCAPLFSPDHVADHFGLQWTDGSSHLLTWVRPGVARLDPEWVAKYRLHVLENPPWARCDTQISPLALGRRVHEQVMQGRRWGAEITAPWR
jgi:hypothetical protein